mgnify:CR=1 FL=1
MYLNKIKIIIIFFLILSVISINKFAFAEIIKPNNGIEPLQVVKIQLKGLKNNNKEYKDYGIEQTWAFAHPDNQRYTGPLEKFKIMLKGKAYSMLLNHKEHNIKEIFLSEDVATFEVIILNSEKYFQTWACPLGANKAQIFQPWVCQIIFSSLGMPSARSLVLTAMS